MGRPRAERLWVTGFRNCFCVFVWVRVWFLGNLGLLSVHTISVTQCRRLCALQIIFYHSVVQITRKRWLDRCLGCLVFSVSHKGEFFLLTLTGATGLCSRDDLVAT